MYVEHNVCFQSVHLMDMLTATHAFIQYVHVLWMYIVNAYNGPIYWMYILNVYNECKFTIHKLLKLSECR